MFQGIDPAYAPSIVDVFSAIDTETQDEERNTFYSIVKDSEKVLGIQIYYHSISKVPVVL